MAHSQAYVLWYRQRYDSPSQAVIDTRRIPLAEQSLLSYISELPVQQFLDQSTRNIQETAVHLRNNNSADQCVVALLRLILQTWNLLVSDSSRLSPSQVPEALGSRAVPVRRRVQTTTMISDRDWRHLLSSFREPPTVSGRSRTENPTLQFVTFAGASSATDEDQKSCGICREDFVSGAHICKTSCCINKFMHLNCAVQCLRMTDACPFCRTPHLSFANTQ
jgi:hypothetical protein